MLIVVGVDVVASVLLSERHENVPSQRIRVVSDGRDLLRAPTKTWLNECDCPTLDDARLQRNERRRTT